MKKLVLSTILCIIMTAGVSAQEARQARQRLHRDSARVEMRRDDIKCHAKRHENVSVEQKAKDKTRFISKKLSLAEQKSAKLYEIFLQEAQSFEKVASELSGKDEQARKEAFMKVKSKTERKLKSVLSGEEFDKYKEICKERHQKMKDKGHFNHK